MSATVENAGTREGDEVVQVYVTDLAASVRMPIRSLAGIQRVHLKPGERRVVKFTLEPRQLTVITDDDRTVVEPGNHRRQATGFHRPIGRKHDQFHRR
jgi:beta-glucosidase